MRNRVMFWLLACFLISLLCGLVYASTQQILRQGANDPQIQILQDNLNYVNSGEKPADLVLTEPVELSNMLSPFVIFFDKDNKVIQTDVIISAELPQIPAGVFEYTKNNGEDRFTWQPANGLREAAIMRPYEDGFILVGRSLRDVEIRENQMFEFAFIAWVIGVFATSIVFFLLKSNKK